MKKVLIIAILAVSCSVKAPVILLDSQVQFELFDNVPIITCTINGKKAKLVVDTGATTSVIDLNKSDFFGYRYYADGSYAAGYGGNYEMYKISRLDVNINGVVVSKGFHSKDISNITHMLWERGVRVDGIIGSNILRQLNAVIDYRTRTIKIG